MMPRRGEEDPREMRRNLDCKKHAGSTMMPAYKIFSLLRILSSAKTFPSFFKMHVF
jgi:hypothetical protein